MNVIGTQLRERINTNVIGTGPMAVDGIDGRRRGKLEGPRVRTRFSLGVESERADAGRGSQTCHATPNTHVQTETGGEDISVFS